MNHAPLFALILTLCVVAGSASGQATRDLQLPSLGDSSSALISPEKERQRGEEWLREFYRQVRFNEDYLLQDYVESLISSLQPHAGLPYDQLHVLVIADPTMNAFAVPGGIVGVNTGLLTYARSEGELVSVLAHELAHLSRRHFARSIEAQGNNSLATLAGILTGIVLASAVGGDAGLAVISATQAASLDAQLRYSRQNEQEADRLGMQIMTAAGYDPNDVARMFEQMLEATRYIGYAVPEYLRTHPLAESRISDSRLRADQYSEQLYNVNPFYALMRVRAQVADADSPFAAIQRFQAELLGERFSTNASHYGLALAYLDNREPERALEALEGISGSVREHPAILVLRAEILGASGELAAAAALLSDRRVTSFAPHAAQMLLARTLERAGQYGDAAKVLEQESRRRPNDPAVWYELAEARGLEGNILGVHMARARYFRLTGAFNQAIQQLGYARSLASNDRVQTAIIDNEISQLAELREAQSELFR